MKNALYLGMATILCATLAFTLMGGSRKSAVRQSSAQADARAATHREPPAMDAADQQADCHAHDVLLEGTLTYTLHRGRGNKVDRVKIHESGSQSTTILPSSVSLIDPVEDEPELFIYDGCDHSVKIVLAVSERKTRVLYE